MWDELPPLVSIKTNKEESKLTFNAYDVGLFDDEDDKNNNESQLHAIKLVSSFENTTHSSRFKEDKTKAKHENRFEENTAWEHTSTMNPKEKISIDTNSNALTTLMSKWNLDKAKELLNFANAPWHNESLSSELELERQQTVEKKSRKQHLQSANNSLMTSPRIEDVIDILQAYLSRVKAYNLYKNKCTEAYLNDIERAVDRYLLTYFAEHNTHASIPLVSPVKFVEHFQTNWWPAKNNNKITSNRTTTTININNEDGEQNNKLRLENYNNSYNSVNNILLQNVETESEWSSTAREVAKAGLSKASITLKNMGNAWFKTQANVIDNIQNTNTEINSSRGCNEDTIKGNAQRKNFATPANDNIIILSKIDLYYTCDVIPEHYTNEAPSTEALERIRMNYPILLYVLNHTLHQEWEFANNAENDYLQHHQQEHQESTFTNGVWTESRRIKNANSASIVKPIQRKWTQSDIFRALCVRGKSYDEYTRLRTILFLPTIKNVWEVYLQPLHDKAIELIHIAEENVLQVMHPWKDKLDKSTEWEALDTDEDNRPTKIAPFLYKTNSCTSFVKLSKQMSVLMRQVDTAVRNLHSDVEYIDKIHRMDDAYTAWRNVHSADKSESSSTSNIVINTRKGNKIQSNADELHYTCGTIHTMSDQIPVYGLILSRLHRLEMEHRTVLELWDHASLCTNTEPS